MILDVIIKNINSKKVDSYYLDNFSLFFMEFNKFIERGDKILIYRYLKFLTNGIQAKLDMFCDYYRAKYENYRLFSSFLPYNLLSDYYCVDKVCEIKDTPIITSIWNMDRVFDKLIGIGKDVGNEFRFDDISVNNNIEAVLIKELGLMFVTSSNHSINSAIIKEEGKLPIYNEISLKKFLNLYRFDGEKYLFIENNKPIDCSWCIDSCKPMLKELGYLFEIGRVLFNNNIEL